MNNSICVLGLGTVGSSVVRTHCSANASGTDTMSPLVFATIDTVSPKNSSLLTNHTTINLPGSSGNAGTGQDNLRMNSIVNSDEQVAEQIRLSLRFLTNASPSEWPKAIVIVCTMSGGSGSGMLPFVLKHIYSSLNHNKRNEEQKLPTISLITCLPTADCSTLAEMKNANLSIKWLYDFIETEYKQSLSVVLHKMTYDNQQLQGNHVVKSPELSASTQAFIKALTYFRLLNGLVQDTADIAAMLSKPVGLSNLVHNFAEPMLLTLSDTLDAYMQSFNNASAKPICALFAINDTENAPPPPPTDRVLFSKIVPVNIANAGFALLAAHTIAATPTFNDFISDANRVVKAAMDGAPVTKRVESNYF